MRTHSAASGPRYSSWFSHTILTVVRQALFKNPNWSATLRSSDEKRGIVTAMSQASAIHRVLSRPYRLAERNGDGQGQNRPQLIWAVSGGLAMSKTLGRSNSLDEAFKSDASPIRIRLFRGSKFSLQKISKGVNGLAAIRIDRNSGWENPFLGEGGGPTAAVEMFHRWLLGNMLPGELAECCGHGRFSNGAWLANRRQCLLHAIPILRGNNLACWCKPRDPCHGDVLLEIANALTNQNRTFGDPTRCHTQTFP